MGQTDSDFRHRSTALGVLAEKLATLARGRPTKGNAARAAFSQREAAKRFGTSTDSVQRARRIRERGVPELADAVERGELPLKPAADLARLPEPEQRAAVAAGRDAMREAARAAARTRPLTDMQVKARQGREALTILNGLTTIATDAKGYAERLASARFQRGAGGPSVWGPSGGL